MSRSSSVCNFYFVGADGSAMSWQRMEDGFRQSWREKLWCKYRSISRKYWCLVYCFGLDWHIIWSLLMQSLYIFKHTSNNFNFAYAWKLNFKVLLKERRKWMHANLLVGLHSPNFRKFDLQSCPGLTWSCLIRSLLLSYTCQFWDVHWNDPKLY